MCTAVCPGLLRPHVSWKCIRCSWSHNFWRFGQETNLIWGGEQHLDIKSQWFIIEAENSTPVIEQQTEVSDLWSQYEPNSLVEALRLDFLILAQQSCSIGSGTSEIKACYKTERHSFAIANTTEAQWDSFTQSSSIADDQNVSRCAGCGMPAPQPGHTNPALIG